MTGWVAALLVAAALMFHFVSPSERDPWSRLAAAAPQRLELIVDFSGDSPEPSPLGLFPPTEMIPPEQYPSHGILLPTRGIEGLPVETRRTESGVYITQLGEGLFLTQWPGQAGKEGVSSWRLIPPRAIGGLMRVVATEIAGEVALGAERPGEYARLSWRQGDRGMILAEFTGRYTLEQLIEMARSLEGAASTR